MACEVVVCGVGDVEVGGGGADGGASVGPEGPVSVAVGVGEGLSEEESDLGAELVSELGVVV